MRGEPRVAPTVPEGLDPSRDVALEGRGAHPVVRRTILAILGAIVLLALLNVFGQRPQTSRARAPFARHEVQSPERLRGGLIFQTRITVQARTRIAHPTLVMQHGWFESMSVNSIVPDPTSQSTDGGTVRLGFPAIDAGHSATIWFYFQVNPTNLGRRSEDVVLEGGPGQRVAVRRSVTVLP
jgi:hypothetical protein